MATNLFFEPLLSRKLRARTEFQTAERQLQEHKLLIESSIMSGSAKELVQYMNREKIRHISTNGTGSTANITPATGLNTVLSNGNNQDSAVSYNCKQPDTVEAEASATNRFRLVVSTGQITARHGPLMRSLAVMCMLAIALARRRAVARAEAIVPHQTSLQRQAIQMIQRIMGSPSTQNQALQRRRIAFLCRLVTTRR